MGNAQRLEETTARSFARQKPPSAAERESRFRGKAESTPEKERQTMTNPFHQTIAASSSTLPVSSPKGADRMRQWAVRLYNANNDALFHWSAKAKTALEAVATARSRYSDALEAIYRAQGLTRSDASSDLIVAESEVLKASMPNAWRVTNRASWEAAKHPKAQRALLGMPLAHDIVTSIAMTDPGCIAALQHDHALVLGMWLSVVGKDQLIDIDSCWLVSTPDGTVRVPHSNDVLRNVLRLFALRALSPRHAIGNPRSHPFNGYRLVINGQSKTLLAAQMIRKPTPPFVVLNWLESEGFMDVASQYRGSFEPAGEEARSRG